MYVNPMHNAERGQGDAKNDITIDSTLVLSLTRDALIKAGDVHMSGMSRAERRAVQH